MGREEARDRARKMARMRERELEEATTAARGAAEALAKAFEAADEKAREAMRRTAARALGSVVEEARAGGDAAFVAAAERVFVVVVGSDPPPPAAAATAASSGSASGSASASAASNKLGRSTSAIAAVDPAELAAIADLSVVECLTRLETERRERAVEALADRLRAQRYVRTDLRKHDAASVLTSVLDALPRKLGRDVVREKLEALRARFRDIIGEDVVL